MADGPERVSNAVVVCGGQWHDFDFARVQILTALAAHEVVRTRVFENYDCTAALAEADFLITYTCNTVPDPVQQDALVEFVRRGGRWLALHGTNSAIVPQPAGSQYKYATPDSFGTVATVLGSRFLGHPPIAPYRVELSDPGHPMLSGITPFEVTDELYISELHPPLRVLLHTNYVGESRGFEEGHTSVDEPRPVLYFRDFGDGSVCYFTLGHCRGRFDVRDLGIDDLGRVDRGSWTEPHFITLVTRCIAWAVTGDEKASPVR